ncbi:MULTISPECIES: DUF488 domain-containing protein [Gracilibacillus]|uniref:DUF488 domain-containing protein n=1 Tax=Gracilibacillus TaxID=74385 RepID=UPI000825ECE3|nr:MULTISPECIES: DUF488 family protein [Gracilibacillus]
MRRKRVYQLPSKQDGFRILVDRLWPRGVSKEKAQIDVWLKEIGPSPALRKWFAHDPTKFAMFRQKYMQELKEDQDKATALESLREYRNKYGDNLTLVYGAKDEVYNHVVILEELIQ